MTSFFLLINDWSLISFISLTNDVHHSLSYIAVNARPYTVPKVRQPVSQLLIVRHTILRHKHVVGNRLQCQIDRERVKSF